MLATDPASVLVIENHPLMREALCAAIAEEPDLRLAEADATNAEAITLSILHDVIFLPRHPDIILIALGNPGLNELDALKALRQILPATPILALTSNEVPGQEQSALEAGANLALTKAISRAELIRALRVLRDTALVNHSQ